MTAPPLRPHHLRCDQMQDPLGVAWPRPWLSWRLHGPGEGRGQSACRVRVGLRHAPGAWLWDSGRLAQGGQGLACGVDLPEAELLTWQVMVWDESGRPGPWSEAGFGTTFRSPASWPAPWIGFDAASSQLAHSFARFSIAGDVAQARLHVAAGAPAAGNISLRMNALEVRLDGCTVGDDAMSPGQIDCHGGRALVRVHDVTAMLQGGSCGIGLRHLATCTSLVLVLHRGDGSRAVVLPDAPGWRQGGQGAFVQLWPCDGRDEQGGKGEVQDAAAAWPGFEAPGFAVPPGWVQAPIVSAPRSLAAQHAPPQEQAVLRPARIAEPLPGRQVVDFGRNTHGFVRLRIAGRAGDRITVRHAENLLPDPRPAAELPRAWARNLVELPQIPGTLDWQSARNTGQNEQDAQTDAYVLDREGGHVLQPRFSLHGFRYAEVSGLGAPLTHGQVEAVEVHSPVGSGTRFSCSDQQLNRLHDLAHRSLRTNLVSVPTDCPHRERNGWLGDALCVSEAECLLFDMAAFLDLWFTQLADAQGGDGFLPMIVPFGKHLDTIDLPWQSAAVLVAWDCWQATGDRSFLARHLPMMVRWWEFAARRAGPDGLIADGVCWGDWVCLPEQAASKGFIGNAFFIRASDLLARMAGILGEAAIADRCAAAAARCRSALHAAASRTGGWDNGTQSALALALAFDLVPPEQAGTAQAALLAEVRRHGRITSGCLGTLALLPALSACGRDDVVLALATDRERNWGYWLERCDATTGLETWLGERRESSYNHPFLLGSLVTWMYRRLAGIEAAAPGYASVRFAPYLASGLDRCEAAVETPRGLLTSRWLRGGGLVHVELEVPPGVAAEVVLPGVPAHQVGSGRHAFTVAAS